MGKNQILVKNGNLLTADLNESIKYASFVSRKFPKPRNGTRYVQAIRFRAQAIIWPNEHVQDSDVLHMNAQCHWISN